METKLKYFVYCEECIRNFNEGNKKGYDFIKNNMIHIKNYNNFLNKYDEYEEDKLCYYCDKKTNFYSDNRIILYLIE